MTTAVSIIVEMKRRKEPTTPKLMIKGSVHVVVTKITANQHIHYVHRVDINNLCMEDIDIYNQKLL